MKVEPLNDKVIVNKIDPDEKTAGGVFLPKQARESTKRGEVLAVGPGKTLLDGTLGKMPVKEGDEVLFDYGGVDVNIEDKPYMIIAAKDILAVINRED